MNTWKRYDHDILMSTLNELISSRAEIRRQVYENRGFTPAQISELQREAVSGYDVEESIRKLMERGFTREVASQAMRVSNNDFNRALTNLLGSKTTSVVEDINENVGTLETTSRQQQIKDVIDVIRIRYGKVENIEGVFTDAIPQILKFNDEKFTKFLDVGRVIKNVTPSKVFKSPDGQVWTINNSMKMGPKNSPFIYLDLTNLLLKPDTIMFKQVKNGLPIEGNDEIEKMDHSDRLDLLRLLSTPTEDQVEFYKTLKNKKEVLDNFISITKQATGVSRLKPYPETGIDQKIYGATIYTDVIKITRGRGTTTGKGRPKSTKTINKELGKQYELLAGTYLAGNKSILVKRDLKGVLNKLHDNNLITPEDYNNELKKYKLNNIKL